MKLNKFIWLFFKDHFQQTWIAYVFLIISIIYVFYISQIDNLNGLQRIFEGFSLSYIVAYMFYIFINLYPEYIKERQGIITIENELNNIVINISHILGIIKSFSNEDYTNINLLNYPIYVQERNNKWKNFFNPRHELTMYINSLQKELNNIKIKYCVLPINLISILNKIEKLDINEKLKNIYFCLDREYYDIKIQGIPECFIELEKVVEEVEQFGIIPISIITYDVLTEQEKQEYLKEIDDIKTHVDCKSLNGRIYKGGTRIQ